MYSLLLLLLLQIATSQSCTCHNSDYQYHTCQNNTLSCRDDRECMYIERCLSMATMMDRDELSIQRLQQAICGYERTRVKICCDTNSYLERPTYIGSINSGLYPMPWPENLGCGKSLVRSDANNALGSCSVLIGEYNTESDPDCNELFCGRNASSHYVSYVIKHPGYEAASFSNNIALLRLKEAVNFTATAQPICFIPEDRYVSLGSTCTVVGWGRSSGQKAQPTTQQSLQLKLVPKQQCSDYLSQGLSVELCAIGSCEPCTGYSGSPMLYKYADTYFLVGILSYGSSCDSIAVYPSAFVNVQRYTRWILENS